jgi:hypothetical protein
LKYFPCFDQAQTNEDLGCWILDASNESNIFMVKLSLSPTHIFLQIMYVWNPSFWDIIGSWKPAISKFYQLMNYPI